MSKIRESIRRCFAYKEKNKPTKYQVTEQGIARILQLSPKSVDLLFNIISKVELTSDPESYAVKGTYKDFGYKNRQSFSRDRKRLIDNELLYVEGSKHLVNLIHIDFTSRKQRDHFRTLFGLKKTPMPSTGQKNRNNNIPKPPDKL